MTRVLEWFSGAGGAALGIRRALPDAQVTHVERDADACATLVHAFPGDTVWRVSVAGYLEAEYGNGNDWDLFWGSPPCQPHSHAGKRGGSSDSRECWPDCYALVADTRPRVVIIENVRGAPVDEWESDLKFLGYHTATWLLDAADFGVPQTRRRWFVIGNRDTPVGPRPGVDMPTRTLGEALPRLATEAQISAALRGEEHGDLHLGYYPVGLGWSGTQPERLRMPAPTVTTTEVKGTRASRSSGWTFNGGPDRASDAAYLAVGKRRLSIGDCATLQGFPEGHPFQGNSESVYRQIGNAVPPALAYYVTRAAMQ